MGPKIRDLLRLQKHDLKRIEAENQIDRIPKERESLNKKINAVKTNIEKLAKELKEMELRQNQLDTEFKSVEDRVIKCRIQQMEVKKNEEYTVLAQQIEDFKIEVSRIEDQELELMMAIERKSESNKAEVAKHQERISQLEGQISVLDNQETDFKASLADINQAVDEAKIHVDRLCLSNYQHVIRQIKKGPYVVPLEINRCTGCHLTVSNEIVSEARAGENIVLCDSCFRILYIPEE